jgi:hypothetical protein
MMVSINVGVPRRGTPDPMSAANATPMARAATVQRTEPADHGGIRNAEEGRWRWRHGGIAKQNFLKITL